MFPGDAASQPVVQTILTDLEEREKLFNTSIDAASVQHYFISQPDNDEIIFYSVLSTGGIPNLPAPFNSVNYDNICTEYNDTQFFIRHNNSGGFIAVIQGDCNDDDDIYVSKSITREEGIKLIQLLSTTHQIFDFNDMALTPQEIALIH